MASVWGRYRPPVSWYPGHMAKAASQMKVALKRCDLVIEVREEPWRAPYMNSMSIAVTLALLASASAADGTPDTRSRSFGLTAMGAAATTKEERFR